MERNCPQCNRKLLDSIVDKCMYCGLTLSGNLILSDSEKTKIAKRIDEAEKDNRSKLKAAKEKRSSLFEIIPDTANYETDLSLSDLIIDSMNLDGDD
ncbi:MAG: hypothetical protein OEY06_13630 [Gammaproteobacteria bacterium]|nr:hypothetical protein [Gammaproteobacteria bacterium]